MSEVNLFSVAEAELSEIGVKGAITWIVEFVDGKNHKGKIVRLDREYFKLEVEGGDFGINKTFFFAQDKVVRIQRA